MMLKLADLSFEVKAADLGAGIPDPYWAAKYNPDGDNGLCWGLEIETAEKVVKGETISPNVSHNDLRFDVRRWMDIAGHSFAWHSAEGLNCGFYVFEHNDIPRGRLRFVRREGLRFLVKWDGRCNVFWDDEYDENVPFSVEAWAEMSWITVHGSATDTDETMRARLAQYFDPDDFVQRPIHAGFTTYEDGMTTTETFFEPIG